MPPCFSPCVTPFVVKRRALRWWWCAVQENEKRLLELLGPINQRVVQQALQAMEEGDVPRLG